MTPGDERKAAQEGSRPFTVRSPTGGEYEVRLVVSEPGAYDRFYNVFANPMLWFIQHYLWDLSNAPDIRRNEIEAFEYGYNVVNEDLAQAVIEEIAGRPEPGRDGPRLPPLHAAGARPQGPARTLPASLRPHPVDAVRTPGACCPGISATRSTTGLLANDIVGFHTQAYRRNFLQCCRDLLDLEVDFERGTVLFAGREVWVRSYPLPIDCASRRARSRRRERTAEFEAELQRRRREHLILRVDRADLSKNVLRGFTAFDLFLEQHPEFRERVTFVAQLMPSRTDVPEYAEYLERIEALVAVVNHRHGTPDWMPINLKLRDDLEEAMASYKQYDVLLVNAMFDGMNLVAKEGPLVNERAGVSILSENTGAHEELGEFALSVNPFDIQELADSIHAALTMAPAERRRRIEGLKRIVTARSPGDWIDDQLADIRKKAATSGSPDPLRGRRRAIVTRIPCYLRPPPMTARRPRIRPDAAARRAGRRGRSREGPRGRAGDDRALREAAQRGELRQPRRSPTRSPPGARGRVRPVPVRGSALAARAAPAHAAHHRRRRPLPDHQGPRPGRPPRPTCARAPSPSPLRPRRRRRLLAAAPAARRSAQPRPQVLAVSATDMRKMRRGTAGDRRTQV